MTDNGLEGEGIVSTIGQLVMHCLLKCLLLLPNLLFKAHIFTLKLIYFVFYLLNCIENQESILFTLKYPIPIIAWNIIGVQ